MKSDDCSSNIHEFCNQCDCLCHGIHLTIEDIQVLGRILERQYISYEDTKAHEVVNELFRILREHEAKKLAG